MKKYKVKKYQDGSKLQTASQVLGAISPLAGLIPGGQIAMPILQAGSGVLGAMAHKKAMAYHNNQEVEQELGYTANPYGFELGGNLSNNYVYSNKLGTADMIKKKLKALRLPKSAVVEYKGKTHKEGGVLINDKKQAVTGTTSRQNKKAKYGGKVIAELENDEVMVDPKQLLGLDEITKNTAYLTMEQVANKNEKMKVDNLPTFEGGGNILNAATMFGADYLNYDLGMPSMVLPGGKMLPSNYDNQMATGIAQIGGLSVDLSDSFNASTSTQPINPIPPQSTSLNPRLTQPAIPQITPPQKTNVSSGVTNNTFNADEYMPLLVGQGIEAFTQALPLFDGPEVDEPRLNLKAGAVESNLSNNRINLDGVRNQILSQTQGAITSARRNRSQATSNALTSAAYGRASNNIADASIQEQSMNNQYRSQLAQAQMVLGQQDANEMKRIDTVNAQNRAAFYDQLRMLGKSASNTAKFIQNDRTRKQSINEELGLINQMYPNFGTLDNYDSYRDAVLKQNKVIRFKK